MSRTRRTRHGPAPPSRRRVRHLEPRRPACTYRGGKRAPGSLRYARAGPVRDARARRRVDPPCRRRADSGLDTRRGPKDGARPPPSRGAGQSPEGGATPDRGRTDATRGRRGEPRRHERCPARRPDLPRRPPETRGSRGALSLPLLPGRKAPHPSRPSSRLGGPTGVGHAGGGTGTPADPGETSKTASRPAAALYWSPQLSTAQLHGSYPLLYLFEVPSSLLTPLSTELHLPPLTRSSLLGPPRVPVGSQGVSKLRPAGDATLEPQGDCLLDPPRNALTLLRRLDCVYPLARPPGSGPLHPPRTSGRGTNGDEGWLGRGKGPKGPRGEDLCTSCRSRRERGHGHHPSGSGHTLREPQTGPGSRRQSHDRRRRRVEEPVRARTRRSWRRPTHKNQVSPRSR